jgi:hypothetical protein
VWDREPGRAACLLVAVGEQALSPRRLTNAVRVRRGANDLQASGNGPTVVELRARSLAPGAGTALTLVHRLDASDQDRAAFLDHFGGRRLRLGKAVGLRTAAANESRHRVDGEVGRRHAIELIPRDRKALSPSGSSRAYWRENKAVAPTPRSRQSDPGEAVEQTCGGWLVPRSEGLDCTAPAQGQAGPSRVCRDSGPCRISWSPSGSSCRGRRRACRA